MMTDLRTLVLMFGSLGVFIFAFGGGQSVPGPRTYSKMLLKV
jgi:hypothetical protein